MSWNRNLTNDDTSSISIQLFRLLTSISYYEIYVYRFIYCEINVFLFLVIKQNLQAIFVMIFFTAHKRKRVMIRNKILQK